MYLNKAIKRDTEDDAPKRQILIAQANSVSHGSGKRFVKQVRLATLGIQMRMATEKRLKSTQLIPLSRPKKQSVYVKAPTKKNNSRVPYSSHQFTIGIAKKAANIST